MGEQAARPRGLVQQQQGRLLDARLRRAQGRGEGVRVGQPVRGVDQAVFQKAVRVGGEGLPQRRQRVARPAVGQGLCRGQAHRRRGGEQQLRQRGGRLPVLAQ